MVDLEVSYVVARKKNSKRLDKLSENETIPSGKEAFIADSHSVICDAFIMNLNIWVVTYSNLNEKFGFLGNYTKACKEDITRCAK